MSVRTYSYLVDIYLILGLQDEEKDQEQFHIHNKDSSFIKNIFHIQTLTYREYICKERGKKVKQLLSYRNR